MVFAREISDPLTSLVKKINTATQKNKKLKSFVVILNDKEDLAEKLKEYAKKNGITNDTPLTIDNPAGPRAFNIAKEADVTVLFYNKHTVAANHAFRKGELNEKAVERVVADLSKIAK